MEARTSLIKYGLGVVQKSRLADWMFYDSSNKSEREGRGGTAYLIHKEFSSANVN